MKFHNYILEGHTPVAVEDLITWATRFEKTNRRVAAWEQDGVSVSTVFLGIDHSFSDQGPPILFETMVFGGELDQEQERYETWEQAEQGHQAMVERVKATL